MTRDRFSIIAVLFCLATIWASCDECKTHQDCPAGEMCKNGSCSFSSGSDIDADADSDTDTDADADSRFDDVASMFQSEMNSFGASGAALAIIEGGEVTFARGFGTKHPSGGDPVEATTLFRIASVTKMLTAAALLQQVEDEAVDLSAPATDYIPYLTFNLEPTWADSITGHQLLTHSSAMVDYLMIDVTQAEKSDDALAEFVLGEFPSVMYLMAPSGAFWNYSNPNYYLAGLMVEEITGSYYAQYMDAMVFTPLAMDRTFFYPSDVLDDGDWAYGETTNWSIYFPDPITPSTYDNGWGRPAGYAFSSVLDLAKWVVFLRDGDPSVLSDELLDEMKSPQIGTAMLLDMMGYGYGLIVTDGLWVGSDFYDLRIIEHDGAMPGFSSKIQYVPDLDMALITLANSDGAYFTSTFETALATLTELPQPSSAPDFSMTPDTHYDAYVGEYNDPYNVGGLIVTRSGDDLLIEMPDLDGLGVSYSSTLHPLYRDNFLQEIDGMQFQWTFIFDQETDEDATYMRNRSFVGVRVPDGTLGFSSPSTIEHMLEIDSALQRAALTPPQPRTYAQRMLERMAREDRLFSNQ